MLEFIRGDLCDFLASHLISGVVHHDVEAIEFLKGGLYKAPRVFDRAYVAWVTNSLLTCLLDYR